MANEQDYATKPADQCWYICSEGPLQGERCLLKANHAPFSQVTPHIYGPALVHGADPKARARAPGHDPRVDRPDCYPHKLLGCSCGINYTTLDPEYEHAEHIAAVLIDVELARNDDERCQFRKTANMQCFNKKEGSMAFCKGLHRFSLNAIASEIHNWTRPRRQRYAMAWAKAAFGVEQATHPNQRALRLLEEAIELYQAVTHTKSSHRPAQEKAHELVDFVFSREVGEIPQELGGLSVCMLVLAEAVDLSVDACEALELHRVLNKPIEELAKRNAAKNAAGFNALQPTQAPPRSSLDNVARLHKDVALRDARIVELQAEVTELRKATLRTEVTEEEYQLFDAVHMYGTGYGVSDAPHWMTQANDALCRAALAWYRARPNDHRTPTEIANGITDPMPTRIRAIPAIKAISSDNARKPNRVMHLRRLPSGSTGANSGPDECLVCHRLAETFTAADIYTYEHDLYGLDARRCDGAWHHPPVPAIVDPALNPSWAKPEPVPMLLWCPECRARHIDTGEFATKSHHTHACQSCGHVWRPAIGPTTGVQFLPGFKNKEA